MKLLRMVIELPMWLTALRRVQIVERVHTDPRSKLDFPLGVSADEARGLAAGGGQADFDRPWRNLSPNDRVLLYAYFFQRGHLEELTEAFRQLCANTTPQNPVVIDLGCGPFTGGLAAGGVFGQGTSFHYIGIDRSCAMRRLGEKLALAADCFEQMPEVTRCWESDVSSVDWRRPSSWPPVIVIVSYLLASPTLEVDRLVESLNDLLKKIGRGHVTVIYTNSPHPIPNQSFPRFSAGLKKIGFVRNSDDSGTIEIERMKRSFKRPLRYAVFSRQEQKTLNLEGG